MNCPSAPCPLEEIIPAGAPSAVGGAELLLRVIVRAEWLSESNSIISPTSAAFPQQELQRKKSKTVSVMRSITDAADTIWHASKINKQKEWNDDPVVAKASAEAVRRLKSSDGSREACVLADPDFTSEKPLMTHASIVRACPLPAETDRLSWHDLRLELAAQFEEVRHLSGEPVDLTKISAG